MKVVVMGCTRVGALVSHTLADEGNLVTVLDTNEENLRRLPDSLGITTLLGDGTLEQDLIRAGIEEADAFLAVEPRDARNALAAQKVQQTFGVAKVVCQIADPARQEMYKALGLEAISPAMTISGMLLDAVRG
jgi:trk system potassium uptake protein TrkA